MRGILLLVAVLPLWAQTEPQFACAGNRAELLFYPEDARKAGLEGTVLADFAINRDGVANDLELTSTVVSKSGNTVFAPVVQTYLERSNFPPGCEKARKQLRFEFVLRGKGFPSPRTSIEFKLANTFRITADPMMSRTETSGSLSPGQCLGSRVDLLKYPEMARATRTEGIVKVTAQVDSAGKATSIAIQSGPPLLRQTVKEFLEQSEFATCRGAVEISFQFALRDQQTYGPVPTTVEFLEPNNYRMTADSFKTIFH